MKLRATVKTAFVGRLMPPVWHFGSVDDAKRYGPETVLCGFTLPLSLTPVSFLFLPVRPGKSTCCQDPPEVVLC
jgi:hypothetical protein